MSVPYTFATQTGSIPLSELDSNFATAITIGNTAVYLGNTTTSFGNVTLTNVTISSGNVTASNITANAVTSPAATNLLLQSAGTTAVTIDTSQNVGIGTTSVTSGWKMQVNGATLNTGSFSSTSGDPNFNSGGSRAFIDWDGTKARIGTVLGGSTGGPVAFYVNNSEVSRFDTGGNFLVNTTTRTGPEKMSLWYSSNIGPAFNIRDTTAQNGNTFIQFNNGSTTAGAITSNGTTTMTYGSASDYRLKENLSPLTGALAKVAQLQPKVGLWKADSSEFVGFIAHELQTVFPDAVVGEKDAVDANGNPKYQMVDAGSASIIATLTAAIQELNATITQQAADIAALKAKVGI